MKVEINCDMGESFGLYKMGDDESLMPYIAAANVACGFHASDYNHMSKTVLLAKTHKVNVGAHPSLPDLQGFGRRELKMNRDELANCLIYQIGALQGFLKKYDMPLNHIKPHGTLYGMAARDEDVAHAVCDAADVFKVPLYGLINCNHQKIYSARDHIFIAEFFADLEYDDNGGLIITREHASVDPQLAAERAVRAAVEGKTKSINNKDVAVKANTICVHSDTPNAVNVAKAVNEALQKIT